ncbi:MAG TPA: diaminopropionate ammonia-lyase [Caulobacteraceae bacterium]
MFLNPGRSPYSSKDRDLIGVRHAALVQSLLGSCPAHQPTPLVSLTASAADCGLAGLHVKAEWARMGLSSFKALGGGYAVALLVLARAEAALGRTIAPQELTSPEVRAIAQGVTVTCASAGNHGLGVAAAARVFGSQAVVFLCESVPESFAIRLRHRGAVVTRAGATYEDSMAHAAKAAERFGWVLAPDSSWPGYTQTALEVMRGYTVLLQEAADTLEAAGGPASHVFVQAGIGGLAGAAASYLRDRWGEAFKFIVVEPEGSPCLLQSAREGRPTHVTGGVTTLGRLDCSEPSLLAFELLSRLADAFMLITDAQAEAAASRLNGQGANVSACGAAGAAGLFALCGDPAARRTLDFDAKARVLLIGTEAAEIFIAPGESK